MEGGVCLDERAEFSLSFGAEGGGCFQLRRGLRRNLGVTQDFSASTLDGGTVFVNIVHSLNRELGDEIAAIGDDADQFFFLQPYGSLAHRSTARRVLVRQVLLGECLTGPQNSGNDVFLQSGVNPFGQR